MMTNAFNLVAIANLAGACFLISYLAVFVAHWRLGRDSGNVLTYHPGLSSDAVYSGGVLLPDVLQPALHLIR